MTPKTEERSKKDKNPQNGISRESERKILKGNDETPTDMEAQLNNKF